MSRGSPWGVPWGGPWGGPWGNTIGGAAGVGVAVDDSILEEPRSVISQLSASSSNKYDNGDDEYDNNTSWEVLARRVARPASALN